MSGSSSRRQAIKAVMSYEKEPAGFTEPMGDTFGRNVFGLSEMRKRLPKHVFKAVAATIDTGAKMDPQIADYVAGQNVVAGDRINPANHGGTVD